MSNQHVLKIHPAPLADLLSGAKTAEVRHNDRGFQVGDKVRLMEVNPETLNWTGRPDLVRTISHIQTGYGLPDGLCVLSYADTAQREALARVGAERDAERARGDAAVGDANEAESQLTEAVGLLRELSGELCSAAVIAAHAASAKEIPVSTTLFAPMRKFTLKDAQCKAKTLESILTNECDRLNAFLARHAQVEQQEARGAQAGDEHQGKFWAFRNEDGELCITDRWDVAKHIPFDVITLVERAALATQPAVPAEVERLSSENAELKASVERLEATVQDERQLRAKVGRIAHYLNEFASGRSTFSRIQEINDAIQGVSNGN